MSCARGGEDREEKFIDRKILQRENNTDKVTFAWPMNQRNKAVSALLFLGGICHAANDANLVVARLRKEQYQVSRMQFY
jgi:hypothetical protein